MTWPRIVWLLLRTGLVERIELHAPLVDRVQLLEVLDVHAESTSVVQLRNEKHIDHRDVIAHAEPTTSLGDHLLQRCQTFGDHLLSPGCLVAAQFREFLCVKKDSGRFS